MIRRVTGLASILSALVFVLTIPGCDRGDTPFDAQEAGHRDPAAADLPLLVRAGTKVLLVAPNNRTCTELPAATSAAWLPGYTGLIYSTAAPSRTFLPRRGSLSRDPQRIPSCRFPSVLPGSCRCRRSALGSHSIGNGRFRPTAVGCAFGVASTAGTIGRTGSRRSTPRTSVRSHQPGDFHGARVWSPDGDRIAWVGENRTLVVYDITADVERAVDTPQRVDAILQWEAQPVAPSD
jgi:hypothetical protein